MPRIIGTVVVIIVVLAIRYFTVDSDEVVEFNDDTLTLSDQIDLTYDPFWTQVTQYAEGNPVSAATLKQSLANGKSQSAPLIEELKSYSVPDEDECRNFHAVLVRFADMYAAHHSAFDQIVAYVETHDPPTEEDSAHVADLIAPFETEFHANVTVLDKAQREMANKHDLLIE